jgi:1,2-diacylglycerol 3-alpha-glucosyltransferase
MSPAPRDARDLVVCGDGDLRPRLHALARELGLEQRVHWPGFVQYPDLPVYYALADAFILASTIEPWGLVVNEAMACGLPVLVSDRCGCAPDLVPEGQNGFTFKPRPAAAGGRGAGPAAR